MEEHKKNAPQPQIIGLGMIQECQDGDDEKDSWNCVSRKADQWMSSIAIDQEIPKKVLTKISSNKTEKIVAHQSQFTSPETLVLVKPKKRFTTNNWSLMPQ